MKSITIPLIGLGLALVAFYFANGWPNSSEGLTVRGAGGGGEDTIQQLDVHERSGQERVDVLGVDTETSRDQASGGWLVSVLAPQLYHESMWFSRNGEVIAEGEGAFALADGQAQVMQSSENEPRIEAVSLGTWHLRVASARRPSANVKKLVIDTELAPGPRLIGHDVSTGAELPMLSVWIPLGIDSARVPPSEGDADSYLDCGRVPSLHGCAPRCSNVYRAWVNAPGYAWRIIDINPGLEEIRIGLFGVGSLELSVEGDLEGSVRYAAHLRPLRKASGARLIALDARSTVVDGLPSGNYLLTLLRRPAFLGGPKAGQRDSRNWTAGQSADIRILSSQETRFAFAPVPPASSLATYTGTLTIPPELRGYLHSELGVEVVRRAPEGHEVRSRFGAPFLRESAAGVEWRIPSLDPGLYDVIIEPHGFRGSVDLSLGGDIEEELRHQDFSLLLVHPVDAKGAQVDARVYWRRTSADGRVIRASSPTAESGNAWAILSAGGGILVTSVFPKGPAAERVIETSAGVQEMIVECADASSFIVELAASFRETEVALPPEFASGIRGLSGGKKLTPRAEPLGGRLRTEGEPASNSTLRYRLTFYEYPTDGMELPELPDLRAPEFVPIEYDLNRDSILELVLTSKYNDATDPSFR